MALMVKWSHNEKLGRMGATYTAMHTCPPKCPILETCYAQFNHLGYHWRRITRAASSSMLGEALDEARQLIGLPRGHMVRLHVAGDMGLASGVKLLALACRYLKAFGYTHWWHRVQRKAWGKISMLASCETETDVLLAHERGYATALVLPSFPSPKRFRLGRVTVLPCPEQTGRAPSCAACRLCFDDRRLHAARLTIGFAAHGSRKQQLQRQLQEGT